MVSKVLREHVVSKWLITVLAIAVLGACGSDGKQVPANNGSSELAENNHCSDTSESDSSVSCHGVVDGIHKMVFSLSAEALVPPLVLEGATAEANFSFDENSSILSGSVSASGLSGDATAAYLQRGFAGSNGEIVLALEASSAVANVFNVADSTQLSAEQRNELLRGEYYINVQTIANKAGEIRGQLLPDGVRSFRATLSGDQAVPPIDSEASGIGAITYQTSTDFIWGSITVAGIDATAANLHMAKMGETGPVAVSFTLDPNEQNVWRADGVPAGDILIRILSDQVYFSVTADTNPREIRGQIPGARPLPITVP